tara:strand:- start:1128 stop:1421 length:294 start_codon:yes stop_codon:yes gene_type:complete
MSEMFDIPNVLNDNKEKQIEYLQKEINIVNEQYTTFLGVYSNALQGLERCGVIHEQLVKTLKEFGEEPQQMDLGFEKNKSHDSASTEHVEVEELTVS